MNITLRCPVATESSPCKSMVNRSKKKVVSERSQLPCDTVSMLKQQLLTSFQGNCSLKRETSLSEEVSTRKNG